MSNKERKKENMRKRGVGKGRGRWFGKWRVEPESPKGRSVELKVDIKRRPEI